MMDRNLVANQSVTVISNITVANIFMSLYHIYSLAALFFIILKWYSTKFCCDEKHHLLIGQSTVHSFNESMYFTLLATEEK